MSPRQTVIGSKTERGAAPPSERGRDEADLQERTEVKPVRYVRDERGRRHWFPWPHMHAVLMRARRVLLALVIVNIVLAVLGMAILGPWGFIPAAPLIVLVPLLMVAIDLDRRAMGARTPEEQEALTIEEGKRHPEERPAAQTVVEAFEQSERYTRGEARSVAIGLFLFAAVVGVLAFVAGMVFGRPLLGFGALFLFGYVALLGSVIAFAGMHELYEDEHGVHRRQHKEP